MDTKTENGLTSSTKDLSPKPKLSESQAELVLMRAQLQKLNRLTGKESDEEIRLKYAVWLKENERSAAQRALQEAERKEPRPLDTRATVMRGMQFRLQRAGIDSSAMSYEQMLEAVQKVEREEEKKRNAELALAQRNRAIAACEKYWNEAQCPRRHSENLDAFENSTNEKAKKIRDLLVSQASYNGGFLVALLGPRGCGKTQIAVSTIHECCREGYSARYIKAVNLFQDLRSAFTPVRRGQAGMSEVDAMEKWIELDLLVVDEVHQRGESAWEQNAFVNLLDQRYDRRACTILLANQSDAEFSAMMGDSVVSRIHETGQVFTCSWPSYRTPGQWLQGEDAEPRKSRVKNWQS